MGAPLTIGVPAPASDDAEVLLRNKAIFPRWRTATGTTTGPCLTGQGDASTKGEVLHVAVESALEDPHNTEEVCRHTVHSRKSFCVCRLGISRAICCLNGLRLCSIMRFRTPRQGDVIRGEADQA